MICLGMQFAGRLTWEVIDMAFEEESDGAGEAREDGERKNKKRKKHGRKGGRKEAKRRG